MQLYSIIILLFFLEGIFWAINIPHLVWSLFSKRVRLDMFGNGQGKWFAIMYSVAIGLLLLGIGGAHLIHMHIKMVAF